jgi:hypothetical protein
MCMTYKPAIHFSVSNLKTEDSQMYEAQELSHGVRQNCYSTTVSRMQCHTVKLCAANFLLIRWIYFYSPSAYIKYIDTEDIVWHEKKIAVEWHVKCNIIHISIKHTLPQQLDVSKALYMKILEKRKASFNFNMVMMTPSRMKTAIGYDSCYL